MLRIIRQQPLSSYVRALWLLQVFSLVAVELALLFVNIEVVNLIVVAAAGWLVAIGSGIGIWKRSLKNWPARGLIGLPFFVAGLVLALTNVPSLIIIMVNVFFILGGGGFALAPPSRASR